MIYYWIAAFLFNQFVAVMAMLVIFVITDIIYVLAYLDLDGLLKVLDELWCEDE